MDNPVITVVVPIYNVERYLNKCIESILIQTYTNIEIILIDDGSTDSSSAICDEYEKKDNRIRVIHKKNGGLSDARNTGIRRAKGEYIGFIDADDFIEIDMYETLYHLIKTTDSDIAICNYSLLEDGRVKEYPLSIKDDIKEYSTEEAVKQVLLDNEIQSYAWNKLYKTSLFDGIEYPYKMYFEDTPTTYKLILKAKKVSLVNKSKYYYVQRNDSICGDMNTSKLGDLVHSKTLVFSDIHNRFSQYTKYCYRGLIMTNIIAYNSLIKTNNSSGPKAQIVQSNLNIRIVKILCNKYIPVKFKFSYVLFRMSKRLYQSLYRNLRKMRKKI